MKIGIILSNHCILYNYEAFKYHYYAYTTYIYLGQIVFHQIFYIVIT